MRVWRFRNSRDRPFPRGVDEGTVHQIIISDNDDSADNIGLIATGDARIFSKDISETDGLDIVLEIEVPKPAIERLIIESQSARKVVYLPGEKVYSQVQQAIDDDHGAVHWVLNLFDSPLHIPLICGSFLNLNQSIELIESVSDVRSAANYLHSYRYEIVRSSIVPSPGLSVESKSEVKTLIQGLNTIDHFGDVDVLHVFGDLMATMYNPDDIKSIIDTFGYNFESLEEEDDGFFFACYLANLVLSEGLESAKSYAQNRQIDFDDWEKRDAYNADYFLKGEAWRSLISQAAEGSCDEFSSILSEALFWSAQVDRSDSRTAELLFAATEHTTRSLGWEELEARARFERYISAGHRLRRQHCFKMSYEQFQSSINIASKYPQIPQWKPVYSSAVVQTHLLRRARSLEQAKTVLDNAIEDLVLDDFDREEKNMAIHHLTASKLEIKADLNSGDEKARAEFLKDALAHYRSIGFHRSKKRIERKLEKSRKRISSTSTEQQTEHKETDSTETVITEIPNQTIESQEGGSGEDPLPFIPSTTELGGLPTEEYSDYTDIEETLGSPDYPDSDLEKETTDDDPYVF